MTSRAQSPVHSQSITTSELLAQLMVKVNAITICQNILRRENENRMEELSKLAKNLGYSGEMVTDNPEIF